MQRLAKLPSGFEGDSSKAVFPRNTAFYGKAHADYALFDIIKEHLLLQRRENGVLLAKTEENHPLERVQTNVLRVTVRNSEQFARIDTLVNQAQQHALAKLDVVLHALMAAAADPDHSYTSEDGDINLRFVRIDAHHIHLAVYQGVPRCFLSALRRFMLAEVPTMALHSVHFHHNPPSLHKMHFIHRLGLIPIRTSAEKLGSMSKTDQCPCEELCDQCCVVLEVRAQCPDPQREPLIVWSHDIMVLPPHHREVHVTPNIPLLVLHPGQSLNFRYKASKSTARNDVRWKPTSVAWMTQKMSPTINQAVLARASPADLEDIAKDCPRAVFDAERGFRVAQPDNCTDCGACQTSAADHGLTHLVEMVDVLDHFDLHIETIDPVGQGRPLTASEILFLAIKQLHQQLAEFRV